MTVVDNTARSQTESISFEFDPLRPLALLLFTGRYMFALPYAAEWRNSGRPD